jgi:hypothetical protein
VKNEKDNSIFDLICFACGPTKHSKDHKKNNKKSHVLSPNVNSNKYSKKRPKN